MRRPSSPRRDAPAARAVQPVMHIARVTADIHHVRPALNQIVSQASTDTSTRNTHIREGIRVRGPARCVLTDGLRVGMHDARVVTDIARGVGRVRWRAPGAAADRAHG